MFMIPRTDAGIARSYSADNNAQSNKWNKIQQNDRDLKRRDPTEIYKVICLDRQLEKPAGQSVMPNREQTRKLLPTRAAPRN